MSQEMSSRGDRMTRGAAPASTSQLYATPPGEGHGLRIVLFLPERIPAWISTFLDMASGTSWIKAYVVPVTGAALPAVMDVPLDLRAFLAIERARGGLAPTLALVPIPAFDGIVVIPAVSADLSGSQVANRVRELHPDLILSLGPQSWIEPMSALARWGCWDIDAGLVDPLCAGIPLLAPILRNESATPIELELQLHRTWRAPTRLGSSFGSTVHASFAQQRHKAFLKLPLLLLRAIRRLACDDVQLTGRHAALLRLTPPSTPFGWGAGVRALAAVLHRITMRHLKKRHKALPWVLLLRQDRKMLDPLAPQLRSVAVIAAEPGDFWADPCVVEALGRKLVFVEEMTPAGKGLIACLELEHDAVRRLGLVLEEPGHLSFPQVLCWNDAWYLTVESGSLRRVSLYKATGFPLRWTRVEDLISGRVCADPVLHFHEGHWYLFATVAENGNSTWDELFLFVSDQLTGPFRPHPGNPVVSDVRCARPAGRLFHRDGKLIRPAQDCASGYGSAVVFNEVLELTPTGYRERTMSRLALSWQDSLTACHTYSAASGVEILDAKGFLPAGLPRVSVIHQPTGSAISSMDAQGESLGIKRPVALEVDYPPASAMAVTSATSGAGGINSRAPVGFHSPK